MIYCAMMFSVPVFGRSALAFISSANLAHITKFYKEAPSILRCDPKLEYGQRPTVGARGAAKTVRQATSFGTGMKPAPIGIVQSGISAGRTSGIEAVLVNTAGGVTEIAARHLLRKPNAAAVTTHRLNAPTARNAVRDMSATVLNCAATPVWIGCQRNDPVRQLCI
jgi:hypothetical protein